MVSNAEQSCIGHKVVHDILLNESNDYENKTKNHRLLVSYSNKFDGEYEKRDKDGLMNKIINIMEFFQTVNFYIDRFQPIKFFNIQASFKYSNPSYTIQIIMQQENKPQNTQPLAQNDLKISINSENTKQQNNAAQTSHKTYFFQSQTKRLKQYYQILQNRDKLINKKILFNNSSAFIRYFGYLKHQGRPKNSENELWVGAEWQQEGRGKHNGTVNGFKYFQCPDKQGSLLKFEKIQFGYKLQTALFKRYFRVQELHHAKNIFESLKAYKQQLKHQSQAQREKKCQELIQEKKKIHKTQYDSQAYVQTLKKNRKIMIQFIGFDQIWAKINNLDKLQSISLAQCKICDLGPKNHLKSLLTNLKVLSLQNNFITNWEQIYQLGYELPKLTELSVAYNILEPPSEDFLSKKYIDILTHNQTINLLHQEGKQINIFPNLKCLILIGTKLNWKNLFKVIGAFPEVQQLHLCKNKMTDVECIDESKFNFLSQLNFLNLQEVELEEFQGLMKFSELPKLQKMILNKNKLTKLGRNIKGFANLKSLSIQLNQIDHPVVLYQISNFKSLQSLNIKHNPVADRLGKAYVRLRAVAEVSKLKYINGAMLKKYERKDCEIFYLRQAFREYFALKNVPDYDYDFADFLKYCDELHPNIPSLIKRYGNPYEVQEKKEIKEIVKQQVKNVELKKGTGMIEAFIEIRQTNSVDKRKLPLTWTLSSLRNFIAKTAKIPVGMQKLTIKVQENSQEQQMTQDHKPLSYYNLRPQSRIFVTRIAQ